jgi:asparagine synthase (glutamine-hydrolysing)
MCGIVTIFRYCSDSGCIDKDELIRICDHMAKRGPDGQGAWFSQDGGVGLGHRRLAIIDLSDAAAQPMTNEDKSLVITFNGEIYNYQALRSELIAKGCRFRTTSDTEVLLHLYAEKGREMVYDLRGMYAFAIWDAKKKGMFLARDPFGIKPLYYADNGKTFRAASQVKALLAGGRIDTAPEPAGHAGFFLWGHVPEPYTMYKAIRSLPAGTALWVGQDGKQIKHSFYKVSTELALAYDKSASIGKREMKEHLRTALLDTVRHHLIADVPVGVFLSAGLDSSTLTALASEAGAKDLHTVTLGFKEFQGTKNDEVPLAERTAQYYGTKHRTIWLEKADFQDEFAQLLDAMDLPSIDGVNSYFVSKVAKEAGLKVVLSGIGGDELFGGYPSFRQIPKMVRLFSPLNRLPAVGRTFRTVSAPVLKHFTSPKYAGLLEYGGSYGAAYLLRRGLFMPWELPEVLDGEILKEGWGELQTLIRLEDTVQGIAGNHLKVSALETCWYMQNQLLRDIDWASMAHSIEVRVPLVDITLLEALGPLFAASGRPSKQDMARAPHKPLPDVILTRGKTGFTVPVREWIMKGERQSAGRGLKGWAKKVYGVYCGRL